MWVRGSNFIWLRLGLWRSFGLGVGVAWRSTFESKGEVLLNLAITGCDEILALLIWLQPICLFRMDSGDSQQLDCARQFSTESPIKPHIIETGSESYHFRRTAERRKTRAPVQTNEVKQSG
jgi:hypothetical protein